MASRRQLDENFQLITRRIPEENIHGADIIHTALAREGKKPVGLWVTSPTGKPHIGYLIPLLKFADFLRAGVEIIVVLLDVYSFLDNVKYPMEQVVQRMHYYRFTVEVALEALGIPSKNIKFIAESSYQINPRFFFDQCRLCTLVPQQAVRDAWDRSYNPDMLAPMLCPGLQTLAEEHLDIDFQFGGTDQRGIFEFAERFLPQLGYRNRAHLMNPMLPNLYGDKMSSSHPPHTKIMFLDDEATVEEKVRAGYLSSDEVSRNGVLATLRDVLIPLSQLQMERWVEGTASVERVGDTPAHDTPLSSLPTTTTTTTASNDDADHGLVQPTLSLSYPFWTPSSPAGTVFTFPPAPKPDRESDGDSDGRDHRHYATFEQIMHDLTTQTLRADDIVAAVAAALNQILAPVRAAYRGSRAWRAADRLGYPEES
ncbi:Tyrosine--tRNA ligase, cytoplasmic [Fonsecaea pedrosoi]|nr:Tyrosine--tRNA ligase, cytoplasmic [Fonsecaea pedrosoi]